MDILRVVLMAIPLLAVLIMAFGRLGATSPQDMWWNQISGSILLAAVLIAAYV